MADRPQTVISYMVERRDMVVLCHLIFLWVPASYPPAQIAIASPLIVF